MTLSIQVTKFIFRQYHLRAISQNLMLIKGYLLYSIALVLSSLKVMLCIKVKYQQCLFDVYT